MANTWTLDTNTGVVGSRIFKAAENTAIISASLPTIGNSLTHTETASGETLFGWTASDFDFTSDDFDFIMPGAEGTVVDPPLAPKRIAIIRQKVETPDRIEFKSFEVGEKVYEWATNATVTTGSATFTVAHTRMALIIEILGLGIHYFPSVECVVNPAVGGVITLNTQQVYFDVFAGDSVTSGYTPLQWQAA